MNRSATRLGLGGSGAELALLGAAVVQHAIESVGIRKSLTDTLEILLGHSAVPVVLDTAAARVVRKANQRAVLVGVEVLGVVHLANTVLEALDILGEQLLALSLGDRGAEAAAVTVGRAVVAVACIHSFSTIRGNLRGNLEGGKLTNGLVADGVGIEVGAEALQLSDEVKSAVVDRGALFDFGGECHRSGSKEGDDGSGELHLDIKNLGRGDSGQLVDGGVVGD